MEFKGIMMDKGRILDSLPNCDTLRKHAKRKGINYYDFPSSQVKLMIAYAEGYSIGKSEAGMGKSEADKIDSVKQHSSSEKTYKNILLSIPDLNVTKALSVTEEQLEGIKFMANEFLSEFAEVQISFTENFEKIS